MKHTNFYGKYQAIEMQERREIAAAVKAHGGEYVFIDTEDEDWSEDYDYPVVVASSPIQDNTSEYIVSRVRVENESLIIYGFDREYGYPEDERELYYIGYGYLESILDAIPETDDVHDVREIPSENEKAILVLSREDVESVGYDPNMTDDQFQSLAWAMCKAYEFNMDIYWDALQQSCEHIGLTPLNKETDEE